MEKLFHLKENHTDVKTEVMAGITTFMTMAYILAVNPTIMSAAGMDKGALLTATALAAFIGTILMALVANYPFALAPGMGLNAFFAFTVVGQMGYSWQTALAAVCLDGRDSLPHQSVREHVSRSGALGQCAAGPPAAHQCHRLHDFCGGVRLLGRHLRHHRQDHAAGAEEARLPG